MSPSVHAPQRVYALVLCEVHPAIASAHSPSLATCVRIIVSPQQSSAQHSTAQHSAAQHSRGLQHGMSQHSKTSYLRMIVQKVCLGCGICFSFVLGQVGIIIHSQLMSNDGVSKRPHQLPSHIPQVNATSIVTAQSLQTATCNTSLP